MRRDAAGADVNAACLMMSAKRLEEIAPAETEKSTVSPLEQGMLVAGQLFPLLR